MLTLAAMLAAPLSAQAAIVFEDTFNVTGGSTTDLNFEFASRQAAGTTTSTYNLVPVAGGNDILGNDFRKKQGSITADTNFASAIGANDFTLSIDGRMATTVADWSAFSLLGDGDNRGSSPFSFLLRGNDNIVVTGGSGTLNKATIQGLGGAAASWDANTFANYAFVATATDANSGTFDFTINGVVAESNVAYDFGAGDAVRQINWIGQNTVAVGRWDNVRLDVVAVPEPSSLALLAIGSSAVFFRRKK